jgi:putative transposase
MVANLVALEPTPKLLIEKSCGNKLKGALKERLETMLYKTDLTDAEWDLIKGLFPRHTTGRPKQYSHRAVMNAIRYQQRTGCQWDMLPNDLPPEAVVRHFFYEWRNSGLFEQIQQALHTRFRELEGRAAAASLGIIDAQSVKTVQKGGRVGMMQARKSKDENVISSWMPQAI